MIKPGSRQRFFVVMPVEVETYVDAETNEVIVGSITSPNREDVARAIDECTTCMDKADAWLTLTQ